MSAEIKLYVDTEAQAIWLSNLLKEEMEDAYGGASNEHIFALGSKDKHEARMHEENADENREYANMLKAAYNDLQKQYFGQYAELID